MMPALPSSRFPSSALSRPASRPPLTPPTPPGLPALQCTVCCEPLAGHGPDACSCTACGRLFTSGERGYLDFSPTPAPSPIATTSEAYAAGQEAGGHRLYREFLAPYFRQVQARRVLEVGCGIGQAMQGHLEAGGDGFGLDLPDLARHWQRLQRDPTRFVCGDATRLPFVDGSFDVVYSLGVIEHIGTINGHCTLAANYLSQRRQFAQELLRVTRPGGRVVVACPNKHFPLDVQHGPSDALSPRTWPLRLREAIHARTRLNVHATWGRNHLLSYGECRALFLETGLAHRFVALPMAGYFGFGALGSGPLRPLRTLLRVYVEHLPAALRATGLNPYLLAEITR